MTEQIKKTTSLRRIYNAATLTCLFSTTILGGTLIKADKDYGSPPSAFKEMEKSQINDVHNALRWVFGPLALAAAGIAFAARKRSPQAGTTP